jgi:hypothetical protein
VRFTARRAGESDLPLLYPRLLRDSAILPKAGIAIQYFESMRGRERRDVDAEALARFFGDPKLARGLIACLARSYRFLSPQIEDVVTPAALRRLRRAGLDSPVALRLRLFDDVNDRGDGFLRPHDRGEAVARLERELRLRRGELDRLLQLDAPERAVLQRIGPQPAPEDLVADYNFFTLEALLRLAERVELTLRAASLEPEHVAEVAQGLCAAGGVQAAVTVSGRELLVAVFGRQDTLGVWARHGRRVARTVLQLLERARDETMRGEAIVAVRGRRARLRLTPDLLDILSGVPAPATGWRGAPGWEPFLLHEAAAALRRGLAKQAAGRARRPAGSGLPGMPGTAVVRRWPEPLIWASGVIIPDLAVLSPNLRALASLICIVRSTAHATRLASVLQGATAVPTLLFAGAPDCLAPLEALGAWVVAVEPASAQALARALVPALAAAATGTPAATAA